MAVVISIGAFEFVSASPATAARRPGVRHVKNLGWLRRNWQHVNGFTLAPSDIGFPREAYLVADCDGEQYVAAFASASVAVDFLHRPVFYGLPLRLAPSWDRAISGYMRDDIRVDPGATITLAPRA